MARVVISGYYGFNNLGDEAVLAGMVSALRRQARQLKQALPLEIVVFSRQPEETAERYGVKAVSRGDIQAVLREISACDLLLSGGGSLLQDITSWRTIPFYLSQVFFAQLRGKKTVFYAQGVGPIRGRSGRLMVRLAAKRADLITVRDSDSLALLRELGVEPGLIRLTSDPVFALAPSCQVGQEEPASGSGRGKIGIVVRPWMDNAYLKAVARAAVETSELSGSELLIIPLYYQQDLGVSQQLTGMINHITGEKRAGLLKSSCGPLEMINLFGGLEMLIGVRLHSLIFAALQGVPFAALSYDPKVDGFLKMVGLDSGLALSNLDGAELSWLCRNIWEKRREYREQLEIKSRQFWQEAEENARMVLELL